ncbi:MAG: hypothetical protein M9892_09030 [Bacteroidetes bacterium]|nr:hypothetical protein [Bacteroidota bacterium]
MRNIIFILLLGVVNSSIAQSFKFSNKNLEIIVNSHFQNDTVLLSTIELKNISSSLIYLPKGGYSELIFFPNNNEVLLDLTNSKIGKGNPHYYQSIVNLDLLEPNKSIVITIPYKRSKDNSIRVNFVYEYLVATKSIKDNCLKANDFIKRTEKLNINYSLCFD